LDVYNEAENYHIYARVSYEEVVLRSVDSRVTMHLSGPLNMHIGHFARERVQLFLNTPCFIEVLHLLT